MLAALLCLCVMLGATTTSPAAANQSRLRSACSARYGCALAAVLAHASDSQASELEEEPQDGAEEAATAEVEAEAEAEAEEDASPTTGSDSADSVSVSHLELTERSTSALARRLPSASTIAFSFTLSATANVHVTIVKQTSAGGHKHWTMLPDSLTLSLTRGHVARSLKGRNHLSPGRYRLTVKPTGGRSRSIYLNVQP